MTDDVIGDDWRDIPGFLGFQANALGAIRSLRRRVPRLMKVRPDRAGYLYFGYRRGRDRMTVKAVHVAVASAFHGPRPDGLQVRHLNGNKLDNRAENLCYGTPSENMRDQIRHGTHNKASRTSCAHGHPFNEVNTYTAQGYRICRVCNRAAQARLKARRVAA